MLDRILALLDREIASIEHNVLHGGCPDYTVYRELCAALTTLNLAKDIAKRAFSEEDDEE